MLGVMIVSGLFSFLIATGLLYFVLRTLGVTEQLWTRSITVSGIIIGVIFLSKLFIPSISFLLSVVIPGLFIKRVLVIDSVKAFGIPVLVYCIHWLTNAMMAFVMLRLVFVP
jgi:hypothetical protein